MILKVIFTAFKSLLFRTFYITHMPVVGRNVVEKEADFADQKENVIHG